MIGSRPSLWTTIPLTLRERGTIEGWSTLRHQFQRHFTDIYLYSAIIIMLCALYLLHSKKKKKDHAYWLINNDQAPRPHILTMRLLDHDDAPRYYWSSYMHASTVKI